MDNYSSEEKKQRYSYIVINSASSRNVAKLLNKYGKLGFRLKGNLIPVDNDRFTAVLEGTTSFRSGTIIAYDYKDLEYKRREIQKSSFWKIKFGEVDEHKEVLPGATNYTLKQPWEEIPLTKDDDAEV